MKKVFIVLSVVLFVAAGYCPAQLGNASVSGQIADVQGAAISQAQVTATNNATGVKTSAKTNSDGYYSLTNLPVGDYTVDVQTAGFEQYVRKGITLTTAQVLGLDVKMKVGSITQSVQVTGGAPLVETRTSDVTQFIESKTIEGVPLGNRKTMNVVQTLGAAVFLNDNVGGSQPTYSLAGGRVQSQMTYLDGGLTQNFRLGAGQQSIDPPIDAVQEIEVLSSTYPAQYGASGGGVVVETSKSGTNRLHGSAYENLRNDAADAAGYFAPVINGHKSKPELRYNIFGATVGGPIKRDKAFFFFSFEGVRLNQGSSSTLTVPTAQERAGNFSQLLGTTALGTDPCDGSTIYKGQIYDPTTTRTVGGVTCRNAFRGNIIPAGSQDAVGAKILTYYPSPTNSALVNNFNANSVRQTHTDYFLIKIDDVLTQKDHITGRYMYYQNNVTATSVFPDPGADPTSFPDGSTTMVYGSSTHTFSSNKVNNFGFSYYRRTGTQFGFAYNKNFPEKLGLTGVPQVSFPAISPSGYQSLGLGSQTSGSVLTQEQYLDDFTWVLGRHALKLGGEFRGSRGKGLEQPAISSGNFSFTTQSTAEGLTSLAATTGNSLGSLLVGDPFTFSISNNLPVDRRTQYIAAYLQDDWSISERLTLNLGLRWETDTPESDARNRLNGFDPNQINPVSGTPGVVKFAGINYPNTAWNGNWKNFSPRIGFAYKPFDNDFTVIRGGYGIYYGPPIDNTTWGGANLGYTQQASLNSPDNGITAPFYLRNGVPPVALAQPVRNDSYGAVPPPYKNANTAVSYFPRHRPTEYNEQFNLTVEHQLSPNLVVTASGLGNLGRRLSSANQNINQIAPSVLGPTTDTQAYRPYPQFSQVTLIAPSIGRTNYFAIVGTIEKRFSNGLNFVSTYTQAKLLGDTNDNANASSGNLGNNNGPYSNYYNRAADYGRTENDIERRFTFNTVYELPFGRGRRWMNGNSIFDVVFGGWGISNLTTVQSGAAMTVVTATNNTNAFSSGAQRPNLSGNPNLPRSKRTLAQWFDISRFSQPAAFTFGNEGVGILNAPGYIDLDFSLLRTIQLPKGSNLQLRADAFNALNHTNLGLPNLTYGAPGFGSISSIRGDSQRELEIGARIAF